MAKSAGTKVGYQAAGPAGEREGCPLATLSLLVLAEQRDSDAQPQARALVPGSSKPVADY